MTKTTADYPLAETQPDQIRGKRGLALQDVTLERLLADEITMADLQITPQSLHHQAEIAADAGRQTLARNFTRAAELVEVPQDLIMSTYELLRPGRAANPEVLRSRAALLRDTYGAHAIAAYIEEAAEIYQKRGLFTRRF